MPTQREFDIRLEWNLPHMECDLAGYHCLHRAEAQKFLCEALQDPECLGCCGICLLGALSIAMPGSSADPLGYTGTPSSRRKMSRLPHRFKDTENQEDFLWTTILDFLLYPRSVEQASMLITGLSDRSRICPSHQEVDALSVVNNQAPHYFPLSQFDYHSQGEYQIEISSTRATYLQIITDIRTVHRKNRVQMRDDTHKEVGPVGRSLGLMGIKAISRVELFDRELKFRTDTRGLLDHHYASMFNTLTLDELFIGNGGVGGMLVLDLMKALIAQMCAKPSRSVSLGKSRTWPRSAKDLLRLPNAPGNDMGEERSSMERSVFDFVQAISIWMDILRDSSPFGLVAEALAICGPVMTTALIEHNISEKLLLSSHRVVLEAFAALDFVESSSRADLLQQSLECVGFGVTCQFVHTWSFMKTLHTNLSLPQITMFYQQVELMAFELGSLALYLYDDPSWPRSVRNAPSFQGGKDMALSISKFAAIELSYISRRTPTALMTSIHPALRIALSPYAKARENRDSVNSLDHPPSVGASDADPLQRLKVDVAAGLIKSSQQYSCNASGCSTSIHEAGQNFKVCARCTLARYCSRECQKMSWRGQEIGGSRRPGDDSSPPAHADVCGTMTTLREASGVVSSRQTPQEMVVKWQDLSISDEQFRQVAAWTLAVTGKLALLTTNTTGWDDYAQLIHWASVVSRGPDRESLRFLHPNPNVEG